MIVWDKSGVYLPQYKLWLDPHRAQGAAWVSHAHADHMKRHERVFCTSATAAMMRARGATKSRFQHLQWGEPFAWGRAQVSLYPAGHVLGSAQMLVEADGVRLLYSGDFKMQRGLSCEEIQVPRADIVVMETTFGLPRYTFARSEEVVGQIANWCRQTLDNGETPVLFCYSLGKGQEVLAGLHPHNLPVSLHLKHARIAAIYAEHGVKFPAYSQHEQFGHVEGVLLCASQCVRGRWWREFASRQRVRTAYISGWALNSHPSRFGTDAAFALSDHADHADLHEYVRQSGASQVWTTHGYAAEFAAELRALGYDAAPLAEAQTRSKAAAQARQLSLF